MNRSLVLVLLGAASGLAACGGSNTPATVVPPTQERQHAESAGLSVGHITADAARAAGMEVATAGPALIRESIPLYGVVVPNAERVRNVSARYAGVVRTVNKAVGDLVKSGETLATVESNDSLQVYAVTAPITGVVTSRIVNPGESVEGQPFFTVTDLSTVWIEVSLFASDAARVHVGQQVHVKAVNGPVEGTGEIVWVSSVGATSTQSLTARVVLDNRERRWTPGLYVSADVAARQSEARIVVKNSAIQTMDARQVVFVVAGDTYTPRPVLLGRRDGDVAEVTQGVDAGERYVSVNSFIVKAEIEKAGAEHED